jgi:valyl-tRNA synthetase
MAMADELRVLQPSGNEGLVEKWILHKLNIAAAEINAQLAKRNFMAAMNAAYLFGLWSALASALHALDQGRATAGSSPPSK